MEKHFPEFPEPYEVYGNFQEFPFNFWLNGSLFGHSAISGFSGNFPRKFPYHLSPFRTFLNFLLNGKRPQFLNKLQKYQF